MQRARNSLQSLAASILSTAPLEDAVVLAWPLACGISVAERTRATAFANGKLTVVVPDQDWRHQLQGFAPQYIAHLNPLVKAEVKEICFITANEHKRAHGIRK